MAETKESLSAFADSIQKKSCTEFGRILGKSALVEPSEEQFDLLLQRLKQQLGEGRGEVILEVSYLIWTASMQFLKYVDPSIVYYIIQWLNNSQQYHSTRFWKNFAIVDSNIIYCKTSYLLLVPIPTKQYTKKM